MIDHNGSIWQHRAQLTIELAKAHGLDAGIRIADLESYVRLTDCPFGERPGRGAGRVWAAELDRAFGRKRRDR